MVPGDVGTCCCGAPVSFESIHPSSTKPQIAHHTIMQRAKKRPLCHSASSLSVTQTLLTKPTPILSDRTCLHDNPRKESAPLQQSHITQDLSSLSPSRRHGCWCAGDASPEFLPGRRVQCSIIVLAYPSSPPAECKKDEARHKITH